MDRHNTQSKNNFSEDVIPAFLSADHILNAHSANIAEQNRTGTQARDQANDHQTGDASPKASAFVIREKLHEAVTRKHIDLFVQPIVTLPQRHIKYFELFGRLRLRAGTYLPAAEYMALAGEEKIINHLDTLLFTQGIKILHAQHQNGDIPVSCFINLKPFTLRNTVFMHTLLKLLKRYRAIAPYLIFELHYQDFTLLSPGEIKILNGLAHIGCRFSLDHVPHIPEDVKTLHARHINFLKVTAETILKEGQGENGFSNVLSKKRNLDINGIDLIVERVEKERQVIEILDYDIKYGQGYLFGRPDFQGVYTGLTHIPKNQIYT